MTVSENPTDEHVAALLDRLEVNFVWNTAVKRVSVWLCWDDFFEHLDPLHCQAAMRLLDLAS